MDIINTHGHTNNDIRLTMQWRDMLMFVGVQ